MIKEPKWYAVYTRPRWEKKVAELLARQGIEQYCPINKVQRQWSDRKKTIEEPLFKSYVFIHVKEDAFLNIKQTDGVINVLYWLGKPAIIRDCEIEAIRDFLTQHRSVQVVEATVNVNDVVRITQGPLEARQGNVIEIMNHYVKVVLPTLQCALVAQVHKSHIEKVELQDSKKVLA